MFVTTNGRVLGQVLLLSSQLVHPDNRWSPIRAILNTINTGLFAWQGMMDFKYEGENLLRASVRARRCTRLAGCQSTLWH